MKHIRDLGTLEIVCMDKDEGRDLVTSVGAPALTQCPRGRLHVLKKKGSSVLVNASRCNCGGEER